MKYQRRVTRKVRVYEYDIGRLVDGIVLTRTVTSYAPLGERYIKRLTETTGEMVLKHTVKEELFSLPIENFVEACKQYAASNKSNKEKQNNE